MQLFQLILYLYWPVKSILSYDTVPMLPSTGTSFIIYAALQSNFSIQYFIVTKILIPWEILCLTFLRVKYFLY